jgi:hypothetical protein
MKASSQILGWLAIIGTIVPQASTAIAAPAVPAPAPVNSATAAADITLSRDGTLAGQLLDGAGTPKPQQRIVALSGSRVISQARTDERGRFSLAIPASGTYVLSDAESSAVVRVWSPAVAPPSAKSELLFVSDTELIRGKSAVMPLGAIVGTAAIIGVSAAVIAVALEDDAS